jgi:hypothetical protein
MQPAEQRMLEMEAVIIGAPCKVIAKGRTFLVSGGRREELWSCMNILKRLTPSLMVLPCPSWTSANKRSGLSITSRWLSPFLGSQPNFLKD